MRPPLDIVPLHSRPDWIPVLAAWHFGQWAYLDPTHDVATRIGEFLAEQPHGCPQTFVAVADGLPVGSASLLEHDLPTRKDLSPWLASVFVLPDLRRRGIASALVDSVVAHAASLGVSTLYLFTPDQTSLYAGLGWRAFDETTLAGEVQTMMRISPGDRLGASGR